MINIMPRDAAECGIFQWVLGTDHGLGGLAAK